MPVASPPKVALPLVSLREAVGERTAPVALRRDEVSEADWHDWRWQLRNRLTTADELARFVQLTDEERAGIAAGAGLFRVGVAPYYASLMDPLHASCPIRMQVIRVDGRQTALDTGIDLRPGDRLEVRWLGNPYDWFG